MTIHLKPEIEALVVQRVDSGAYASSEAFLEQAVLLLESQEAWFSENREEISRKIEGGVASLKRGEFFTPDEVRANMAAKKAAWLAERGR